MQLINHYGQLLPLPQLISLIGMYCGMECIFLTHIQLYEYIMFVERGKLNTISCKLSLMSKLS